YQRQGGPMSWKNGPPVQARAADAKSLGSLGGATLTGSVFNNRTLVLPRPGAPEVIPQSSLGAMGGLGSLGDFPFVECGPGWIYDRAPSTWRPRGMAGRAAPVPPISGGSGSARSYRPTTSMKRKALSGADGLGDCGCGCGGSGGCGGGRVTIKFSDTV